MFLRSPWVDVTTSATRVRQRLMLVVPVTVLLSLFLIYVNTWSAVKTLIVVLAEVMKRIAAPMLGGIVTSFVLELLVYPVLYAVWREKSLKD